MAELPRLMVAPNGSRLTRADHPALPETIEQIIEAARACFDAGAGALHFHVRDGAGAHILDAGLYREALAGLREAVPEMHLQITTEAVGRYSPGEMRALAYAVAPPGISIGVAEMIPGGVPTAGDIKLYRDLHEAGVQVQHICYAPGDVTLLAALLRAAGIDGDDGANPVWCLFVIGHYSGRVGSPDDIPAFLTAAKQNGLAPDWAVCGFAAEEDAILRAAISRGGKIRAGFENSTLMPDGSTAPDNATRIAAAARLFDSA